MATNRRCLGSATGYPEGSSGVSAGPQYLGGSDDGSKTHSEASFKTKFYKSVSNEEILTKRDDYKGTARSMNSNTVFPESSKESNDFEIQVTP